MRCNRNKLLHSIRLGTVEGSLMPPNVSRVHGATSYNVLSFVYITHI